MKAEILFKGMTRPAMLFGVPLVPLVAVCSVVILIAVWTNLLLSFLVIPIYFIMKFLTTIDDFIFRLYFLKFKTFTPLHNKKYYGAKTYTSLEYRPMTKRVSFPDLSILGLDKNPSFEKYLPYSSLIKNDVVISKDYALLSTWKIEGVPFEVENEDEKNFNRNVLNMLFKAFASESVSFYFHSARHDIDTKLNARYKNKYLQTINDLYFKSFTKGSSKATSLYLTLIYNPFVNQIDKSSFSKLGTNKKMEELKSYLRKFEDYSNRLESNLKKFKLSKLKVYETENRDYSTQLEFYNYLIGGRFEKVRALNAPISEYLIGGLKNLQFNHDMVQLNYNDGNKKFARAIEIKDYTGETLIGLLNTLMYLNVNYTITQSFVPLPRHEAKEKLKKQQKQLISSEDDSTTQLEQFNIALDELTSGEFCFGNYHFSILVFGETVKETKANTNTVITTLQDIGLGVTLADIALPATYFSQFPCNFALRPRVSAITSKNYSDLIALHNFPKGKKELNCWGEAITVLKTPSKQPYYFNIHETTAKDNFGDFTLANFLIIGQSGGGKTAFSNFLCNQLLKFNDTDTFPKNIPDNLKKMTLVYLDKDKGALGNILAGGGRYISIKNGVPSGFNPFMIENTPTNKRSLQILLKILVTANGEILSTSEEKKLSNAIDFILDNFEMEERKYGISLLLENLTDDIADDNSLKSRFELWKRGNKYGWVFDNENDLLDFPDSINLYGIDGTEFLDDPDISAPMSFYILWKVTNLIDGRRFGLFADEVWKWLENELVQEETKNKLKTIRKQNGFIGMATQSVEDFLKLSIAKAIIEQSSTHIFFPNKKAQKDDYVNGLNCTEEEFKIIKNFNPAEYPFLVKRSNESAIVNLDLSSLGGENISILSTGTAYIEQVEEIFSKNISLDEKVEELREYYKNKN